jgi:hypothetical protein
MTCRGYDPKAMKLPSQYKIRGRDFKNMMLEAIRYAEGTKYLANDKKKDRNRGQGKREGTSYTNHGGNAATPTQG